MNVLGIPEPALVVLIGPSGAGKSTWAAAHFRREEIVSSDALRAVVGSGTADLEASADAFTLLDQIAAARLGRRLTTVVDTVGSDPARRRAQLELARGAGVPAVAVVIDAPPRLTRARNALRDRPVPAGVLAAQHRRMAAVRGELADEGWEAVLDVSTEDLTEDPTAGPGSVPGAATTTRARAGPESEAGPSDGRPDVILQVSAFPWGDDPLGWVTGIARAADEAGFDGLAVMDHLIQIPQVGRAWDPIPEAWVTLGAIAGLGTRLRLGILVSPVTFRPPGITAKAAATLDVLTGGRSFLGIGAGWWRREHAAHGLDLPAARTRLDAVETAIETIRALWAPGTKPYAGQRISLPETTSYPRPAGHPPIIVGGSGRRTLGIAARLADGCNVPSDETLLAQRIATVHAACDAAGRPRHDVAITVLDVPIVGRDRDDAWRRVERLRGRTGAATYAERHHAGTPAQHRERYAQLAESGVQTIFVAPPDLATPDDVHTLAGLIGG